MSIPVQNFVELQMFDSSFQFVSQMYCNRRLLLLFFQTEFGGVVSQLQLATESQKSLQKQVEQLQYEKDILLEELETTGAINQSLRYSRSLPHSLHSKHIEDMDMAKGGAKFTFVWRKHSRCCGRKGQRASMMRDQVMWSERFSALRLNTRISLSN